MSEHDEVEPQNASTTPRCKRWRRSVLVLVLLIGGTWLFFAWPRPMPAYIVLPEGHTDVRVETWISWMVIDYYRHFYVATEVPRPAVNVLTELTRGRNVRGLREFIGVLKPDLENPRPFGADLAPEATKELWRRWDEARNWARPGRSGDFGDPLPESFIVFRVVGPDDHKDGRAQNHLIFYRLTIKGPNHTLVEVWDNKWFDV